MLLLVVVVFVVTTAVEIRKCFSVGETIVVCDNDKRKFNMTAVPEPPAVLSRRCTSRNRFIVVLVTGLVVVHQIQNANATKCPVERYDQVDDTYPMYIVPGKQDYNECPDPKTPWNNWLCLVMCIDKMWETKIMRHFCIAYYLYQVKIYFIYCYPFCIDCYHIVVYSFFSLSFIVLSFIIKYIYLYLISVRYKN